MICKCLKNKLFKIKKVKQLIMKHIRHSVESQSDFLKIFNEFKSIDKPELVIVKNLNKYQTYIKNNKNKGFDINEILSIYNKKEKNEINNSYEFYLNNKILSKSFFNDVKELKSIDEYISLNRDVMFFLNDLYEIMILLKIKKLNKYDIEQIKIFLI